MSAFDPQDNPDAPLYVGSSHKWEFHKGIVDVNGKVVLACEPRFLIELVVKLERRYEDIFKYLQPYTESAVLQSSSDSGIAAVDSMIDERTSSSSVPMSEGFCKLVNDVAMFFVEISREIRRLQRYQDLYPDEAMLQTFQSAMLSKISMHHQKWKRLIGRDKARLCWVRLRKSEYLMELWFSHPTFEYDLKPWRQFFDDDAPGSGINPKSKFLNEVFDGSRTEPPRNVLQGKFHMIPPGGWALWRTWVDGFQELERKIGLTVIPEHLRVDDDHTSNLKFNEEMNHLEPMQYNFQTKPFCFYPNLWYPRGNRQLSFPADELSVFEMLIGDLEGFEDPEFEDPLTRGLLVASQPSQNFSIFHFGSTSM